MAGAPGSLEEEKAARAGLLLPGQCSKQELPCPSSQGRVSACFCRITSANVALHVFPGLLGLMAKLLVSPRDFLNPPLPGALSQERSVSLGQDGECRRVCAAPFAAFCKAQRCQYQFHHKAQNLP